MVRRAAARALGEVSAAFGAENLESVVLPVVFKAVTSATEQARVLGEHGGSRAVRLLPAKTSRYRFRSQIVLGGG